MGCRIEKDIKEFPFIPLRDLVVFPYTKAAFRVGRPLSLVALEQSLITPSREIVLLVQKDPEKDSPSLQDLYSFGSVAKIISCDRMGGRLVNVTTQGIQRAKLIDIVDRSKSIGKFEIYKVSFEVDNAVREFINKVYAKFERYANYYGKNFKLEYHSSLERDNIDAFCDVIVAYLDINVADKIEFLKTIDPYERLIKLSDTLDIELEKIEIERRINENVRARIEQAQKEYFLSEKIKAIHEELGRKDDDEEEIRRLKKAIEESGMSKEAKEKALRELKRLELMPSGSAEAAVCRNYIDWLLAVPWKKRSDEKKDIKEARKILDSEHFGLEKVKDRILEFLAVRQLTKEKQTSILCFVGPPGVGKSSLARSIANATGRKFVRLSLGGVRDEAEIKGHRRTYVGAFPGQIIQMMKKAGTVNPVFLLDEVDKMVKDFRGDPASALLEVLDPEQNDKFVDHFLDVEYDLSDVFFICTANVTYTIPPPLLDRMEVIEISSYTFEEKLEIASNFLVPKQLKKHGLSQEVVEFTKEGLDYLTKYYTREAGVRNLEREIASICRKVARKKVEDKIERFTVTPESVRELLGKEKFRLKKKLDQHEIGVATGLAWTSVGGELLETEVSLVRGKGKLILTGHLGDVMKESAQAAVTYVRSLACKLGFDEDFYEKYDIHIHIPEGAIPKDGPSAGVTMATALFSVLAGVPVRKDVAMTGEITLRGKVLPVGGIKEKILAAYRAGIRKVLIPFENEKDLEELPKREVLDVMEIVLVKNVEELLRVAVGEYAFSVSKKDKVGKRNDTTFAS